MALFDVPADPNLDPAAAEAWQILEFGKERLLKEIEPLTQEQLFQRPEGFKNSVATLLCHIAAADLGFAHMLKHEPMSDELKKAYFVGRNDNLLIEPVGETKESLLAKLETARAALLSALGTVQSSELDKKFDRPGGNQVTLRWMLTLIGYHATLHTGHIQMVRQHLQ